MTATIVGLVLCVAVGAGCRLLGLPLPAPRHFIGACVLLSMTLGFVAADGVLPKDRTLSRLGAP